MNRGAPLTHAEENVLAELLSRVQWPLPAKVFAALMNKSVSVPIELAVLDDEERVLMIHREDMEYAGHHMPGTVLRDNEDVPKAVQRLLDREVSGVKVNPPLSLGWVEVHKGNGAGQDPNRHQISLLHVCWLKGPYSGPGKFFSVNRLPKDTLPHHRRLVSEIVARLS